MMHPIPPIVPLSDMRIRQAEIIEKASRGPVILVERGSKPALVAVAPELWNALAERLEYLEDVAAVFRRKWQLATGQDEMTELSPETIQDWLGDDIPS